MQSVDLQTQNNCLGNGEIIFISPFLLKKSLFGTMVYNCATPTRATAVHVPNDPNSLTLFGMLDLLQRNKPKKIQVDLKMK